jgi:DsbC/DsbD-like thiol-disulfide interchange protein
MKKISLLALVVSSSLMAMAQNPVSWTFKAKKLADKTYEVTATATIQKGWHIYSMNMNGDIGVPTSFSFTNNALLSLDGKVKANGKMINAVDATTKQKVQYYSNNVSFTQKVKLKGNVKTSLAGSVEFMSCDDVKCLPPKTQTFAVALQ